jgi:MSHA biogenesis protein MshQ
MKHKINKILTALFLFFLIGINNAYAEYTKAVVAGTSFATPTTNWAAGDDSSKLVNLGFTFPFGSTSSSNQVTINSNGALTLSGNWTVYGNLALPSSSKPTIIAPYWDDLNRSNGGTISYGTFGSAGNYRFVVSWNSVPHYPNSGSYTFQVVLYENGDIRYRYSNSCTSCTGASATIGVQENSSVVIQHLFNQATLDRTKDILYTRVLPPLIPAVTPNCPSTNAQLTLTTYNKAGYNDHPNNHTQLNTLVTNYAIPSKRFGSGLINNINTPNSSITILMVQVVIT